MLPNSRNRSTMATKLIDEQFADINGRKHCRYTVRKIGSTFSPPDKYTNVFILANADRIQMTRVEAWQYLRTH
jgi:hypothetical protein